MKAVLITIGAFFLIAVLWVGCTVISAGSWFADRAVTVVKNEIDPVALQNKYEWFKDAAAQLDKKRADIGIYQKRLTVLDKKYADKEMPRTIAEQYMVWQQELAGVKASYNSLAADYNAQMAKWNWRFCNAGSLPAGATEVLPREFRTYEDN